MKTKFFLFLIIFLLSVSISSALSEITLTCNKTKTNNDETRISCNLPNNPKVDVTTKVKNLLLTEDGKTQTIFYENSSTALKINEISMTEQLPQNIGLCIQAIKKFTVTNSELKYIKQSDFLGMGHLIELNFGNNQIEIIPKNIFDTITSLEILKLNDNNIAYLPVETLAKLPNLKLFNIEFNKVERLEKGTFKNNLNLEEIYLNNNNLKSIHENFLDKLSLNIVDLRRNFEFCKSCEVLTKKQSVERLNGCERDRYYFIRNAKEEFENCVNIKTSEAEHIPKTLDQCKNDKIKENTTVHEEYEKCVKNAMVNGVSKSVMAVIDNCVYAVQRDEEVARRNYEACVDDKAKKNSELRTILGNCYGNKTVSINKAAELYNSCVFCTIMSNQTNIDKCEMRFIKTYGDDIIQFQYEVNKHFE
ncbi:hypothetical protein PVAND_015205 [Polypedilum vanderplanki]|uniref:Leucine rich repeat protein n=1 Tax=Polypedilum vanderplanki TaxID=319348 RepID=A0A9J6BCB1_POLVA|nr:hypothetical protein PVAND_015205 [Polypedilum vanderplanki]